MIDYNDLLPGIIRRIVSEIDLTPSQLPYSRSIEAGVLFTDVKGFTKMTEFVSKGGHYSVEIITELLNSYFEKMYESIDNYDGDLIKYGGDSILAIFPGNQESAEFRMNACLIDMKKNLSDLNILLKQNYSLEIDFHYNMNWGEVKINIVGDSRYHLDYFITGQPLSKIFSSEEGNLDLSIKSLDYLKKEVKVEVEVNKLRVFFPKLVNQWLENHKFQGELKNSAVIFVKVANSEEEKSEINLISYNEFYKQLQGIVYFYQGTINKIDYTDKGYLILITFGVPYLHNDDIERAFICSSKISQLSQTGLKTKIGLTYNNIYSGILGASKRYEYGIIGNGVNISARLMNESLDNDFTFSSEILPHIKGRYEIECIDKVKVKGISDEIEIYHVLNELSDFWSAYQGNFGNNPLFGYKEELKEMENNLLICISGISGSGKSHLIHEFLKAKIEERASICLLVLSEFEKLKPFNLFYKLINKYLIIDNIVKDFSLIKNFVLKNNVKVDLEIIYDYFNDASKDVKEKQSSIVYDILTEIILENYQENQVFVIENIQWIDAQSFELLKKLVPRLQTENKKVILTANSDYMFNELVYYSPRKIEMKNFEVSLAKEFFKSENLTISDKAITEILALAHNNPAYIKEISLIIRQNWSDSQGVFDSGDFQYLIRNGKLPISFESVLLNDFETLDEDTKQLLKYASIMGVSFSAQLFDVFSDKFIQEHIETVLAKLTNNRHIFQKLILPEVEYYFNNSLMRDAIYRTILLKEKQKLHLIIAKYYLKNFQENLSLYYEIIANHFIMAKSKTNAVKWCILAAEKNYELSAYGVSAYYYTQAYDFCGDVKQCNEILMSLVSVHVAQNKAPEVAQYLQQIESELLTPYQLDLYYSYKIRLYEFQKDFDLFNQTYQEVKNKIQSDEILFRIKLVSFDYSRMNNSIELFTELKDELAAEINSQPATFGIIYYSILGQYYLDRAEYSLSEENYLKLNQIALEHDKRLYLRISATSLGIIHSRKGNQEQALEYFLSAITIAEEIGDKHGFAKVNTEIAMIYFAQGLDDQALTTLNNCLQVAKYIGDKQQEQTVLYNLGYIYSVLQEYSKAIEYLIKARDIALLINDKVGISYANDGLGDALFQQQKFNEAKKIYEDNLKLQESLHDREGIAHTIGNLANILREEKNYPKALEFYQIQFDALHEIGDKIGEGKALFNWGITYEILADNAKALEKLKEALKLFKEANDINYAEFTQQQIDRISND